MTTKPRSRRSLLAIAGGLIFACLICGVIFGRGGSDKKPTPATPAPTKVALVAATPTPEASSTPGPSPTAAPTATPSLTPTATPTPLPSATERPGAALERALQSKLGKSGRIDGPKLTGFNLQDGQISARFAVDDLLFTGTTARGAKSDVKEILQTVQTWSSSYDSVRVEGTFTLKDAYGNVTEERVLLVVYSRETIERINWPGIDVDRMYDIADTRNIHPELR